MIFIKICIYIIFPLSVWEEFSCISFFKKKKKLQNSLDKFQQNVIQYYFFKI